MNWADIEEANKEMEKVPIKGKDYVLVQSKLLALRKIEPNAEIKTDIVLYDKESVCIKKTIVVDGKELGSGVAEERQNGSFINKTSYVENCDTSALGRALASMGFGLDKSYASADEVANAVANNKQDFTFEEKLGALKGILKMIESRENSDYYEKSLCVIYGLVKIDEIKEKQIDVAGKLAKAYLLALDKELENE